MSKFYVTVQCPLVPATKAHIFFRQGMHIIQIHRKFQSTIQTRNNFFDVGCPRDLKLTWILSDIDGRQTAFPPGATDSRAPPAQLRLHLPERNKRKCEHFDPKFCSLAWYCTVFSHVRHYVSVSYITSSVAVRPMNARASKRRLVHAFCCHSKPWYVPHHLVSSLPLSLRLLLQSCHGYCKDKEAKISEIFSRSMVNLWRKMFPTAKQKGSALPFVWIAWRCCGASCTPICGLFETFLSGERTVKTTSVFWSCWETTWKFQHRDNRLGGGEKCASWFCRSIDPRDVLCFWMFQFLCVPISNAVKCSERQNGWEFRQIVLDKMICKSYGFRSSLRKDDRRFRLASVEHHWLHPVQCVPAKQIDPHSLVTKKCSGLNYSQCVRVFLYRNNKHVAGQEAFTVRIVQVTLQSAMDTTCPTCQMTEEPVLLCACVCVCVCVFSIAKLSTSEELLCSCKSAQQWRANLPNPADQQQNIIFAFRPQQKSSRMLSIISSLRTGVCLVSCSMELSNSAIPVSFRQATNFRTSDSCKVWVSRWSNISDEVFWIVSKALVKVSI